MKIVAPALFLALAGCEGGRPLAGEAGQGTVEYRPEEAGTVDHALCLLGFRAIPLQEARATGHHLVRASINGHEGVFVLDTGANMSVVDVDHVGDFGIASSGGRGSASLPAGANPARQVRIDSLTLGGVPVRQHQIVVTDLGSVGDALAPLAGGTIHGLIGQDVLKEHRAVIDVARPLLYIIEADSNPAPVEAARCTAAAEAPANRRQESS